MKVTYTKERVEATTVGVGCEVYYSHPVNAAVLFKLQMGFPHHLDHYPVS